MALRATVVEQGCETTDVHDRDGMRRFDFVDPSGNRVDVRSLEEA